MCGRRPGAAGKTATEKADRLRKAFRFANLTVVQVQLDLHFIDALQFGELVEAKCRVTRRTRSLVFMLAELVVGERQRRVEEAWRNPIRGAAAI
ncbi:MAG: hypothetical protein E6G96_01685 [Alphaproteobacteria bacterium]|nr:MAG: hypothetical protein E6G96_01685 [Alphaproteobacteria bacterium]